MKPLFLSIVMLVMLACSDIKKGKQLDQVVLIDKQIDSLQLKWDKEDKALIDRFIRTCSSKIDSIATLYRSQEIEQERATQLELFKRANDDFIELKKIHAFFPTLIADKKQAILALQKDISSGSGRREKYDQYIAFEQQELNTILQQFDHYSSIKKRCLDYYAQSKNTVDSLIQQFSVIEN